MTRTADDKEQQNHEPVITKRFVGYAMLAIGLAIVAMTLAVDLLEVGKWSGFGPSQRAAMIGGIAVCFIGLSLIPFGRRPA